MNRRMRLTIRVALSGCLALILLRLPASGATPAAYDHALAQVQAALNGQAQALQHGTAVPAAQTAPAVAVRVLTPITSVERSGQPPQPVDSSLLLVSIRTAAFVGDIKRRAVALHAAADQVAALRRDVAGTTPSGLSVAQTETSLHAVLARRVYGYATLPPPSLFDRFTEWLDRMLRRLFRPRTRSSAAMPNISLGFVRTLVTILGVGAFTVLVAVLVQWLRRRPTRAQPLALDEAEAALVEARDTDSLRALADEQARRGDYRRAFRLVYLATLVALDTGGVLRFDPSKTNWEYLRALRASGRADIYAAMTPLTRDFDQVWYGFAPTDAAEYARALARYDALQAASTSPPVSRPTVAA